MSPDALRAAIASARLRPRMYGTDAADLATYLLGLVTGASPDGTDPLAAWRAAQLAARPARTCVADLPPLTDAAACDAAEATVAALWPQGDATAQRPHPCGDRGCTEPAYRCDGCGAEGCDYGLRKACRCEDSPDARALYDNAPAQPDALDLDEMLTRLTRSTCSQCGAADPPTEDAERWDGQRFRRHVDCPKPDDTYASEVCDRGLTHAEQVALITRVRELEAQAAAAQPAPLDFAASLAAVRNGRFVPAPRCPQCDGVRRIDDARGDTVPCPSCVPRSCVVCSADWPADRRDCPGCGHPDRDAGAVTNNDRAQLAALAGARFAEEHPYAAGAIMGGIAHRSEVDSGQ